LASFWAVICNELDVRFPAADAVLIWVLKRRAGRVATEIKMPQLGESVVEGTITKWLKKEGESVEEDELLVEVSTDKVDSEIPSSAAGTLQKILVDEGDTVKVGAAIALVGDEADASGADEEPEEESSEQQASEDQDDQDNNDSGDEAPDPSEESKESDDDEEAEAASDEKEPSAEQAVDRSQSGGDTSKRGIISPLVRRLAQEHDVDLDDVEGTGTGGRIRKQDVLSHVERGAPKTPAASSKAQEAAGEPDARPAAASAGEREELVPWTNIRRRTAEHMVASAQQTARAWNAVEVDWTGVVSLREKAKKSFRDREGFNLTYMGFLGRALCEALLEMPEVNATYDVANKANLVKRYVNLGIAVALEGGGLIVPVIQAADEKNLVGLARAVNEVAIKARSKKLSPDDLVGGSFTITNPGPFGSIVSVPIIPLGQAAILGFESIQKRVVVTEGDAIAIRSMGFLSLSWDHRVIDGAEAARFLSKLKERIETTDFSSDLSPYL